MASRASTMRELIADFIDTLNHDKAEILESTHPEDRLHEEADSHVPIYNSTLAELLADDPGLATLDDPGLVSPDADIWKRIQVAIYERLTQEASEWLQSAKQEADDEEEEEEEAIEYRPPTDAELKLLRGGSRIYVKPGGVSPRHHGMATITESDYKQPRDRRGVPTGFNVKFDNGGLYGWANIGRVLIADATTPPVRAQRARQRSAPAPTRRTPARKPARKSARKPR